MIAHFRKYGLDFAEQWLDSHVLTPDDCDILSLRQYSVVPQGSHAERFTSMLIPLDRSEDEIFASFNRDTKYKIRRAEGRDLIRCECISSPSRESCLEFVTFYNSFAAGKGIAPIEESEFFARVNAGLIHLSRSIFDGQTIVWHGHIASNSRVTALYSASHFRVSDDLDARAVIGRANRLLHWRDICHFRSLGCIMYDFGGWYSGESDQVLLSINQFKSGFSGSIVDQFNVNIGHSLKGRLFLFARSFVDVDRRKRLALLAKKLRLRMSVRIQY